MIESEDTPELNTCITYARYFEEDKQWVRHPRYFITGIRQANNFRENFGPIDNEVELVLKRTIIEQNKSKISVFLKNNIQLAEQDNALPTEKLIFQPQIRIVLGSNCHLIGLTRQTLDNDESEDEFDEEKSLDLLYFESQILARGHMCAANWREIDLKLDGEDDQSSWADKNIVPEEEREIFSSPDVRTEIIPAYYVSSPNFSWRDEFGEKPELNPSILAEMWDADELRNSLILLSNGYLSWIERQDISHLPDGLQNTGKEHRRRNSEIYNRICDGIDLLYSDDTARLAFCFANKAVSLQASWRSNAQGATFEWRPFQLAFILMSLRGIVDESHSDRNICDLLWLATGGGKTEAYLGLIVFTIALQRLRALRDSEGYRIDTGVSVISRYTLRLLTIQQFRRAVNVITACELLRVKPGHSGQIGWRPGDCQLKDNYLWGTARLSVGLWVGGGVTPNNLNDIWISTNTGQKEKIPGAMTLLKTPGIGQGEPAQITQCPCCGAHLAISQPHSIHSERPAFPENCSDRLHFVFYCEENIPVFSITSLSTGKIEITDVLVTDLPAKNYHILSIRFVAKNGGFSGKELDDWWENRIQLLLGRFGRLESACASRPGYFFRSYQTKRSREKEYNFDIYCPSPECPLSSLNWREKVPVPIQSISSESPWDWQEIAKPFQSHEDSTSGTRIPIPALTVDDQLYSFVPSMVVATVDKFARLAFEPKAASLFGFITHYHSRHGYYRVGCHGITKGDHPDVPSLKISVNRFSPPGLILQDELHLIDGPLGSMVGIYETIIDTLSERIDEDRKIRPKYIASTATVRQAADQVQALFDRKLSQFPAPGININDNFFSYNPENRKNEDNAPGRLYLGVCAPGKGAQTPIVRIWSTLLQTVHEMQCQGCNSNDLDPYWTLVGYFNAIRELAGVTSLYRQDIPQRMQYIASGSRRPLSQNLMELSSRVDALQLPSLLKSLENTLPDSPEDAVLATSMFGTGVDVSRLGLMVVHGQPKTTSAYIQATGRVGRNRGGLVITFLRASRPRDLDHYEFFTGYHRHLYRSVEPVSVAPFSPRARERALGPICVALLRQAEQLLRHPVNPLWSRDNGVRLMSTSRNSPEVNALGEILQQRANSQPHKRAPKPAVVIGEVNSEIDRWKNISTNNEALNYHEYCINKSPTCNVVLGDAQHQQQGFDVAYEDAPQSLREVESTTGFRV